MDNSVTLDKIRTMELLAPAGGMPQLVAALKNGADAVYLGLESLNARRGADNFTPMQLAEAVNVAHAKGVRVFLTLNIILNTREIGRAVRSLELAVRSGVDAVLITDPALLLFSPHYPQLEFHFSTQAAVSSSAGIKAAQKVGIKRVVLAREMSCEEIKAAAVAADVETEIFVQGALCMSVSGRCLLSSWGGGRSGNRGACASPCRVDWRISGTEKRVVLSPHDLCLGKHLAEMADAGVRCLKIEGRLKNADWVGRAVALYRNAIDEGSFDQAVANSLGDYTGRGMTDGYFVNSRGKMLGLSGRESSTVNEPLATAAFHKFTTNPSASGDYSLTANVVDGKIECCLVSEGETAQWQMTITQVRHEKRAISMEQVGEWLQQIKVHGRMLFEFNTDYPDLLVPKNFANKLLDKIGAELRLMAKPQQNDDINSIELPQEIRALTNQPKLSAENERYLGHKINMLRIYGSDALTVLEKIHPEVAVIVEAGIEQAAELVRKFPEQNLVFSLPAVIYEKSIPDISGFCVFCAQNSLAVEVNGWDGWWLAYQAGAEIMGGYGMAVLNSHAGLALGGLGFKSVSYSLEAGQRQLEDLSASMPIPGVLWVFARPVLACTRIEMPLDLANGTVIEDSRGIKLCLNREAGIMQMRPVSPFNISAISNNRIRACWIGADFCGSKNVLEEWQALRRSQKNPEMFNYQRGLY